MENNISTTEDEIELTRLLHGFFRRLARLWWLVLLLAVLGGTVLYAYTRRTYRPLYQAQAVFSVSVSYGSGTDILDYANYYDFAAAKLAAETFPYLIRSEAMEQRLKQQLGVEHINGTITASSLGGSSNFFRMSVTSSDPNDAYDILRAVMELYPQLSRQVIGQTQLTVNREPVVPKTPVAPFSWYKNTALGAGGGLLIGLVLLFLPAWRSETVYKSAELKQYMNLPCLSCIPEVRRKKRTGDRTPALLLTHPGMDESFCEAFRLLRLKLLRLMEPNGEQVILFTGSVPAEGKSCIAANTALALVQVGKKVLLIDGDLRLPNLKATLQLHAPSRGLGHMSADGSVPKPLYVEQAGLYLLADDTPLRDPAALLRHHAVAQTIAELRKEFDYILIDTPPCLMMADAVSLSRYADRVVYVVRQDYATRAQIADGIQSFGRDSEKLAGFVFNRDTSHGDGHYGYRYGKRYDREDRYGYGKR